MPEFDEFDLYFIFYIGNIFFIIIIIISQNVHLRKQHCAIQFVDGTRDPLGVPQQLLAFIYLC